MSRRPIATVGAVLLGLLSIAAGPPVALRVEVEPAGAVGDDTAMSITVQIAPEDRSRVGRDIWVQTELLERGQRVDRLARALDVDDRGQAEFEAAWPPGEYELRVEVKSTGRGIAGIWIGPVTVPAPGAPAASEPADSVEEPVGGSVPATAAEIAKPPAAGPPEAGAMDAAGATDVAPEFPAPSRGSGEEAPAAAAESPSPVEPERSVDDEAVPVAVVAGTAAGAAAAAAGRAATEKTAPEQLVDETAEPKPDANTASRVERIDQTAEPEAEAAAAVPAPPAPEPAQTTSAPAAPPGSSWPPGGDSSADVTVVVTDQNRPIIGLDANAFELRVGKVTQTLETVGDSSTAPLNLGLVVALTAAPEATVDEVARQLGGFSLRTRSGGDLMLVTPGRAEPSWGATPDDIARNVEGGSAQGGSTLPDLVAAALPAFDGRRGRSFLVVVTDGEDPSDKAAWKAAIAAAETSGVPVLVVGLRDVGFAGRARSSLGRIAQVSGGRSYFLGDAGMAGMTLDYLGELVDASYALPYRIPDDDRSGPREVKVGVANRGWEVAHPDQVP